MSKKIPFKDLGKELSKMLKDESNQIIKEEMMKPKKETQEIDVFCTNCKEVIKDAKVKHGAHLKCTHCNELFEVTVIIKERTS